MKDKESHCTHCVANFATFLLKSLLNLKKMDEFNYLQFLQFLNDPNELLQAQDLHLGQFPTFSLSFVEYFGDFSSTPAQNPCDPESS